MVAKTKTNMVGKVSLSGQSTSVVTLSGKKFKGVLLSGLSLAKLDQISWQKSTVVEEDKSTLIPRLTEKEMMMSINRQVNCRQQSPVGTNQVQCRS